MSESFILSSRLAAEGEELMVNRFPNGSLGLASVEDVRRHEKEAPRRGFWHRIGCRFRGVEEGSDHIPRVCVPAGAYLIVKDIPGSVQQKYGLESEEGAVFVQATTEFNGCRYEFRFNNGVRVMLQELRAGQSVEVLSLAGTRPALYERELQML